MDLARVTLPQLSIDKCGNRVYEWYDKVLTVEQKFCMIDLRVIFKI